MASVDTHGNPLTPISGQPVESAWGAAVADRIVAAYPTTADRDQSIPSPHAGQSAFVQSLGTITVWSGSQWVAAYGPNADRDTRNALASHSHTAGDLPPLNYLPLAGGTLSGSLGMGGNRITNVGSPSSSSDAATRGWADGRYATSGHGHDYTNSTLTARRVVATSGSFGSPSFTNADGSGMYGSGGTAWIGTQANAAHLIGFAAGSIRPNSNGVVDIGVAANRFRNVYADGWVGPVKAAAGWGTTTNTGLWSVRQTAQGSAQPVELLLLTSSQEYKRNIAPADTDTLIDRLRRLPLRQWQSVADGDDPDRTYYGVVLEELDDTDGWEAADADVANSAVVPLVAATQRLLERVDELERRLDDCGCS